MRLRDTLRILAFVQSHLELQQKPVSGPSGPIGFEAPRLDVTMAVVELSKLAPFSEWVQQLRTHPVWTNNPNVFYGDKAQFSEFSGLVSRLRSYSKAFTKVLTDIATPPTSANIVSIRVPDDATTLDHLAQFNADLREALDNTIGLYGHRSYRVVAFDTGSQWYDIEILVQALGLLYSCSLAALHVADRAMRVAKEYRAAERLGIENEELKMQSQFADAVRKKEIQHLSSEIERTHGDPSKPDHERVGKLGVGIRKFEALFARGSRIDLPALSEDATAAPRALLTAQFDALQSGSPLQLPEDLTPPAKLNTKAAEPESDGSDEPDEPADEVS